MKENENGSGFVIVKRIGYAMEDFVVGGVASAISRFFASKGANEAIQSFYERGHKKKKRILHFPDSLAPTPLSNVCEPSSRDVRAMVRGRRIHQLVYHRTECCTIGRFQENSVVSSDMMLASSGSSEECCCHRSLFEKEWGSNEINAVDVFLRLLREEMNLVPIFSELLIWSPELNLATKIDLLCVDEFAHFVLVSLKTGRYGKPETPGETEFHFRKPMSNIRDSIKNRHDIQLLIELLILVDVYKLPISDAFVVYLGDEKDSRHTIRRPIELARTIGISSNELLRLVKETLNNPPIVCEEPSVGNQFDDAIYDDVNGV